MHNRDPFMNRPFDNRIGPIQRPYPYNFPPHMSHMPHVQPESPLKGLAAKGFNGLAKTLDHVQSFANMMETAGPMIEKYKPVVKNLPMMLQMLKAMQDTNISDDQETSKTTTKKSNSSQEQTSNQQGISRPKLYIE